MQPEDNKSNETVRRAALPEVMFAADLALALGLSELEAEAAARRGMLGPPFFVRGRVALLREDFLELLVLRASRQDRKSKELLGDTDADARAEVR